LLLCILWLSFAIIKMSIYFCVSMRARMCGNEKPHQHNFLSLRFSRSWYEKFFSWNFIRVRNFLKSLLRHRKNHVAKKINFSFMKEWNNLKFFFPCTTWSILWWSYKAYTKDVHNSVERCWDYLSEKYLCPFIKSYISQSQP
jgi:hypothetical protein